MPLPSPPRHLPRLVILITVALQAMGIGIIFPVMPDLLEEVLGVGLSEAALWGGVLVTAFAAMQFLCGPLMGNLSDAYGRRAIVLTSASVIILDYVIMALAQSVWLLLIGRLVAGITAAVLATANAYMADISGGTEKARNFGLVFASFGAGFVLGPALGGLVAELGTRAPFWCAAGLCLGNLALALFLLPETLPPAQRRPFRWRRANPFAALRNAARLPGLRALFLVYLIYITGIRVYGVIWAYFAQERFGWEPALIGVSLTLYGVALALVHAVIFAPVHRRLGPQRTVLTGFSLAFAFFAGLTVLKSGLVTLILTPFSALGQLAQPALTALASDAAAEDAQGELQGVLSSLQALAMVLCPLLMTPIFRAFTAADTPLYLPGAPFAASALLMLGAATIFTLSVDREPR